MNFKAQGTIEYMLIIGAVIVLSLFVIQTASGTFPSILSSSGSSSKILWKDASPIALVDWVVSSQGKMLLVLKNNSFGKISLKGFYLSLEDNNTVFVPDLNSGSEYIMTFYPNRFVDGCEIGSKYVFKKVNIRIDYNTPFSDNLTESAPADITGTC